MRAGRLTMGESYAVVKNGEILWFGAQITPLIQASTHVLADSRRTRKLLLHRAEIDKLIGKVERDGYTLIPTACYWKGNKVKLEIALAKASNRTTNARPAKTVTGNASSSAPCDATTRTPKPSWKPADRWAGRYRTRHTPAVMLPVLTGETGCSRR